MNSLDLTVSSLNKDDSRRVLSMSSLNKDSAE